ncbi:MAG: DUF4347 domain-containing protein [Rhodospirillaceae bacterium]|nr:DUF4347 domain-containing protein [Rhodospirillales bacterium]
MMFDGAMAADLAAAAPPPEPAADNGGDVAITPTDALPSALPSESATHVVVIIDANVADPDAIANSAPANAEIIRLTEGDGLTQIAAALDGRSNINSIHIFSHGDAGTIQLGSTLLTSETITGRLSELQTIGESLSSEGDILIYGCDVADGAGEDLLAQIAAATGADVAASTDPTGANVLGGWNTQTDSDVTRLSDGGFVISWWSLNQDGSNYGLYGQRYNADGSTAGGEFLINTSTTNSQNKGALAGLTGGGFVATWQSQHSGTWQTMGQVFAADGTKTGSEFTVGVSGGQGTEPSVTSLSDGGFLVSYEGKSATSSEAYARRYSADCTALAAGYQINSTTAENQMWLVQTQLSNGHIAAVWQSNNVDGVGDHYGRIFDINGNALTGEFLVNTFTANSQTYPQIAALSNGGFVATWASWYQNGDVHSDIYGQLFDANGGKVGGEFLVNTVTESQQDMPEVTALPTGGFVVTWQSNPPGQLFVSGQVYDNNGTRLRTHKLDSQRSRFVIQGSRREPIDGSKLFLAER